jgi:16S rRNA C1402 N4-methylase RsmH
MVKQAFRDGVKEGIYKTASQNTIVPRRFEVMKNPRSASAKFRWAVKA